MKWSNSLAPPSCNAVSSLLTVTVIVSALAAPVESGLAELESFPAESHVVFSLAYFHKGISLCPDLSFIVKNSC